MHLCNVIRHVGDMLLQCHCHTDLSQRLTTCAGKIWPIGKDTPSFWGLLDEIMITLGGKSIEKIWWPRLGLA